MGSSATSTKLFIPACVEVRSGVYARVWEREERGRALASEVVEERKCVREIARAEGHKMDEREWLYVPHAYRRWATKRLTLHVQYAQRDCDAWLNFLSLSSSERTISIKKMT